MTEVDQQLPAGPQGGNDKGCEEALGGADGFAASICCHVCIRMSNLTKLYAVNVCRIFCHLNEALFKTMYLKVI